MNDVAMPLAEATAFLQALRTQMPGLSLRSAEILLVIAQRPGLNMSRIGRACGLTRPTSWRLIGQLLAETTTGEVGLGLVEAVDDPEDPRNRCLHLTPAGEAAVARLLAPF